MSIKTISYADLLEHVIWAFDLYEPYNRNERLKEKRSFGGKQDLYVDQLKSRIRGELCPYDHVSNPSTTDGEILINGLLDFSEAAVSFVLSKPLITPMGKDLVYNKYAEYILTPILASYIAIAQEFLDVVPSMFYLDKLLITAQNDDIVSAVKKTLSKIIDRPECKFYRDDLIEFIQGIRADRTQLRVTILQKINIAKETCNAFLDDESKRKNKNINNHHRAKHLQPLIELQKAYSICNAILYFNMKTGLASHLARQYRQYKLAFFMKNTTLAAEIARSIQTKRITGTPITPQARWSIEKLWKIASSNTPRILDEPFNKAIETLYYLLIDSSQPTDQLKDLPALWKLIDEVLISKENSYLHPYAITLKSVLLIQGCDLQEAKELLAKNIEMIANDSIGNIAYYASVLLIGLKIKTNPKQIKNGSINPQIQAIINTQPLYIQMFLADGVRLGMNVESIISDHYSHTILRSIKTYNKIIYERLAPTDSELEPEQAITDAWDGIECALQKFDISSFENPQEDSNSIIPNTLSEADRKAILITYLPKSTLYNCIREFDGISSYIELSPDRHPIAYNTLHVLELRKRLLKTIDPVQYELDTKDFTIPNVATVANISNRSD